MPIGFTLEPKLTTFIVARIPKSTAQATLKQYKSQYPNYFDDYNYLKLMRNDNNQQDHILMVFCKPNDLDVMKPQFNIQEFIEMQLPAEPPIDSRQKTIYDKYWNISYPQLTYPHKQLNKAHELLESLTNKQQCYNRCILYNEQSEQVIVEAEDEQHINPIRHAVMVAMEKLADIITQQEQQQFKQLQYIATDLTLIVIKEPCIMCSMALIHSRIKAVYYQETRAEDGGLNNITQINNMKTLNHRYQVFHK